MNSQLNIVKTSNMVAQDKSDTLPARGGLVIEANTIYEIDEDCLECLKKEKNR